MDGYVAKPIEAGQLFAAMEQALGGDDDEGDGTDRSASA